MANISKLKVQEILEHFITITKDFSILSYWKFVVLTTALACLILMNMVVTTTVGSKANSNVGKRFGREEFNLPEPKPLLGCKFSSLRY